MTLALLLLATPANAAFPGKNGKLLITPSGSSCLSTVNPDGLGLSATPICNASGPRLSPTGTRVVYNDNCTVGVFAVNLDGTNQELRDDAYICPTGQAWSPDGATVVIASYYEFREGDRDAAFFTQGPAGHHFIYNAHCPPGEPGCPLRFDPDWSPDGTKIAYSTGTELRTVGSSGGADNALASSAQHPSWSPDGSKIAFQKTTTGNGDIWTMNGDGTGQTNVTTSTSFDSRPAWSPDGTKIAFTSSPDGLASHSAVWTMNADGTGAAQVTSGTLEDWQPIPQTYARPKAAFPIHSAFTLAYKPCTAPNSTHGAPLSYGSCSPPEQASDFLSVGTADSNRRPTGFYGYLRYDTIPGDIKLDFYAQDIRNKSDLSDYTGELRQDASLRITDKSNSPSVTGAATSQDGSFPVTVPCVSTSNQNIGSTCQLTTSVNSLVPGAVVQGKRAIWQLGQIQVHDGGSDGVASTTADNTLFLDQGIFVP